MGGSKTVTSGYRYAAGIQIAINIGAVDAVTNFWAGERSAWNGLIQSDATVIVNAPDLFGGDSSQGGVVGAIDFQMGLPTQAPNAYVKSILGSANSLPAYRGLFTATFRGISGGPFLWTANSPYFKNPWLDLVRITKGWYQDNCWYPTKAGVVPIGEGNTQARTAWVAETNYTAGTSFVLYGGQSYNCIVTHTSSDSFTDDLTAGYWQWTSFSFPAIEKDMNPAHIIYQAMTDPNFGMGYPATAFDQGVWQAAADQLYDESFGLSIWWEDQSTVKDFAQGVLDTINGAIRLNLSTGLFELRLIRDGYNVDTLPVLNESNVMKITSFERVAWGDTANEIVLTYTDREEMPATIAVQDLAAIESQGGNVISATRSYPGIRNPTLANRVAMRDLNTTSTPMAKVTLTCNRIAWDWDVTDLFVLTWDALSVVKVPFRIASITKSELADGSIEITAVEDRFGLPNNAYIVNQPNKWIDPVQPPTPVAAARIMEAPYFDIARGMSQADQNALTDDYGFAESFAGRTSGTASGYDLWESPNNSVYAYVARGNFTPYGTLAADVPLPDGSQNWSIQLSGGIDLDQVNAGSYFYVDNEAFVVVAMNALTQTATAQRAVIDTVPAYHTAGSKVFFPDLGLMASDPTQYTAGQVSYWKHLPSTSLGTLPLSQAIPYNITFAKRAQRPYAPGKVQLGGQWYPADYTGAFTLTWAHRDRTQQTVSLNDYTTGNIGPETDVIYTVKLYSGATLVRTYTAITTPTWTYADADALADGQLSNLRVTLESVRDGLSSWQLNDLTTQRHGLGFDLGQYLGGQLQ